MNFIIKSECPLAKEKGLVNEEVSPILDAFEFTSWAWVPLEKPLSLEFYKSWIEAGLHGEMNYLEKHLPAKADPTLLLPQARSAWVVTQAYEPHPHPKKIFKQARVALYAQGQDYHLWFQKKLQQLAQKLQEKFPEDHFLAFTDSAPVLERDLASRGALGWVGKNTCLIHPKQGSLFLIGEIYSTLRQDKKPAPLPDFCGTCQRCLDICPTQALVEPRKLDARKCISYWTIESRAIPPQSLQAQIGDWLFGCDLCQTVCPWNQKVFAQRLEIEPLKKWQGQARHELVEDLRWILATSGKQITKALQGTSFLRAGPFGLRRNALIVISNLRLTELSIEVENWQEDSKLGRLARQCLHRLNQDPTS